MLGRRGTLQLADRKVSKRHARLRCDGGDWYIEDMGSTNGTYVNGNRVDRPRRVSEGDKLELGATVMVISKLAGAPPEPAPTPIDEPSPASTQSVEDSVAPTQSVDDALPAAQSGRDSLAAVQDGADPLAAWTITLPERGEPERALAASAPDDAVLSIRPLAHHQPPVSAWRRMFPYLILTLVLFAVVANIVLVILFRRDARHDVRLLRAALEQREQATAEMIVQEVRAELRSPSPQQLHALQELHDGLVAKQEMFNERLREELAARDEQRSREAVAREQDRPRPEMDESQAAVARALVAMRQDIVRLGKSANSPA
ncbi:MAG: FHA domain-containing protein, partial [Tepidisphaeraceae bacterium]